MNLWLFRKDTYSIYYTVWKLQNFSVTQILREIKVGEFRDSKSTILTHLVALNFDFYEFLHFVKAENDQKSRFRLSKIAKIGIFKTSRISKADFT